MKQPQVSALTFLALILAAQSAFLPSLDAAQTVSITPQEAAQSILNTLERELPSLSSTKRGHLAIRLWRTSGDDKYLPYIRAYGESLRADLKRYAAESQVVDAVRGLSIRLVDDTRSRKSPRKLRERAKAMRESPGAKFNQRFLFKTYQIRTLGLDKGEGSADYEAALRYLASVDWKPFLLNRRIIRYSATQTTNAVHYLETLGIAAPRAEYEAAFHEVFMQVPDEKHDSVEFLNKLYGLTHLVIADSDFYQRRADARKNAWILEYFTKNIDQIVRRANPDIIGEIAICFKLCGRAGDPIVARVQTELLRHFEKKQGAILKNGKADPEDVEHRNIVAYLALSGWDTPRPGPVL